MLNLIAEEGTLKKPLPKPEDIVDSSFLDEAGKHCPGSYYLRSLTPGVDWRSDALTICFGYCGSGSLL